jgi:hypothetical protein
MRFIGFLFLFLNVVYGESTMCYKNSHSDMASIEQINFDGGLCIGLVHNFDN